MLYRTLVIAMLASSPALAENWDLPLAWPADNFISQAAAEFASEVTNATEGRIDITTHPGGSLGFKGPEMLGTVRDGIVPIGDMLLSQQIGDEPLLGLPGLPFLFGSYDELEKFDAYFRSDLEAIMAAHNQKVLYTMPWPAPQAWVKTDITDVGSMSGIKIRTYDKTSTQVYDAAGMTAVQLPWGEVIPSLAAGTIDGVVTSSSSAIDGSFWEFLTTGYPMAHSWNLNAVTVNLDAWNGLSAEDQAAIVAIAERMQPEFWDTSRAEDAKNMEVLAGHGIAGKPVPEAVRAEIMVRAEPVREEALAAMGDKGQKILDGYLSGN